MGIVYDAVWTSARIKKKTGTELRVYSVPVIKKIYFILRINFLVKFLRNNCQIKDAKTRPTALCIKSLIIFPLEEKTLEDYKYKESDN